MAIRVKGYHGYLKPAQVKKMDDIAIPLEPRSLWEFEGSIGDFAQKWDEKFLVHRFKDFPEDSTHEIIFITSYGTFGTYG
jgi:hypothetical protein